MLKSHNSSFVSLLSRWFCGEFSTDSCLLLCFSSTIAPLRPVPSVSNGTVDPFIVTIYNEYNSVLRIMVWIKYYCWSYTSVIYMFNRDYNNKVIALFMQMQSCSSGGKINVHAVNLDIIILCSLRVDPVWSKLYLCRA